MRIKKCAWDVDTDIKLYSLVKRLHFKRKMFRWLPFMTRRQIFWKIYWQKVAYNYQDTFVNSFISMINLITLYNFLKPLIKNYYKGEILLKCNGRFEYQKAGVCSLNREDWNVSYCWLIPWRVFGDFSWGLIINELSNY